MVAIRRGLLLTGAVLGAAFATALLPGGSAADARRATPGTAVGVAAREFRLAAYRTSVPRGPVRFNLINYGEDGHDLVVRTRGGREVARLPEVRAGQRATLSARLAPGTYRLVCDITDHERRGMRTTIRVTGRS
jgi:hypothetical protein